MSSLLIRRRLFLNQYKKQDGTFEYPFLIANCYDFEIFQTADSSYSGKWFRLTNDVEVINFASATIDCYANLDGDGFCVYGSNLSSTTFQGAVFGNLYGKIINTTFKTNIQGSNIAAIARRNRGIIANCLAFDCVQNTSSRSSFCGGDSNGNTKVMNFVVSGGEITKKPSYVNVDLSYTNLNESQVSNVFVDNSIGIETYYGTPTEPNIINSQTMVDSLNSSRSSVETALGLPDGCFKKWELANGKIKLQSGIFKSLSYIKSTTDGQYILLDYKPNNNTKIIIESKVDSNGGGGFAYGADNGWAENSFSLYYGYKNVSSLIGAWGNHASANDAISVDSLTEINTTKFDNKKLYLNDTLVYTNTATDESFRCSCDLCVFANNREGTICENVKNFYLYSMQVYEEDILLYNLVPVLDSENVPCLLNTLNLDLYYNKAQTSFEYA